MKAVALYERFREPDVFLVALATFCALWIGLHYVPFVPRFDDDGFERLSLILSIEASIGNSLLAVGMKRQAETNLLMLRTLLDAEKTQRMMLEAQLKLNEATNALFLQKFDDLGEAVAEIAEHDADAAAE